MHAMDQKRNLSHRGEGGGGRAGFRRTGASIVPSGTDAQNAIPRFYDPLEYWDLSGLPWNVADEGHRHKLHKWLRLYYATHYLVPTLIDIFTRFPLIGMEFECKDHALTDIYEEIFMRNLNYDEFFVSLGREYWCVGEAFPLGSFDEDLGVWEHEELINPEDVVIDNFPFLNTQQLKIVPPDYLRRIAQTKSPAREWYQLQEHFADLIPYLLKGEHIPISPVMIRQVANKMNNWDDHGTPILLRGLRTLLYEEKLLASQEAIAERLYSPLILAKLGIMDMGEGLPPWIPTPAELTSVRDDLDIALASDFRLMVHHFGLDITSVFGREQMPRLGDDFDRIERRIMQVFGVNPSLLSAGSNSQPYASSALQAEFMNQILKTFQNMLKAHYRERALVVAEAQGHQDYEKKGQTRVPIFETSRRLRRGRREAHQGGPEAARAGPDLRHLRPARRGHRASVPHGASPDGRADAERRPAHRHGLELQRQERRVQHRVEGADHRSAAREDGDVLRAHGQRSAGAARPQGRVRERAHPRPWIGRRSTAGRPAGRRTRRTYGRASRRRRRTPRTGRAGHAATTPWIGSWSRHSASRRRSSSGSPEPAVDPQAPSRP